MFLIYCLETVIIGFYNVIKMIIVTIVKKRDSWEANNSVFLVSGWFFILFFIVHYGFFVLIQMALFGGVSGYIGDSPFGFFAFIFNITKYLAPATKVLLYGFFMVYGIRMCMDFIITRRYRITSLNSLMFQPYLRIFIQQFVVILGAMFLELGAGKLFMLIFVVVKIWFEYYINIDKILAMSKSDAKIILELNNKKAGQI